MQRQWSTIVNDEQKKPYFIRLQQQINQQRADHQVIFPKTDDVFNVFNYLDLAEQKVVILGQDPYHGVGSEQNPQAHGLAFSVNHGVAIPPSLRNIYKELDQSIDDFIIPKHGNLETWAKQGVMLLNTVLTVKQGQAHSHAKLGWQQFTDKIIQVINEDNAGCVFMLWGNHAQQKGQHINRDKHYVLEAAHPSPLSAYRGFFGCDHFNKTNAWLVKQDKQAIDWTVR